VRLKVGAQLRGVKAPVRVLHTVFTRPVSAARRSAPPFLSRSNGGLQALLIFHPLLLSALLQQSHSSLLLTSCQALLCQALHGQGALVLAAWGPSPPAWYLLMGPCIPATVFMKDDALPRPASLSTFLGDAGRLWLSGVQWCSAASYACTSHNLQLACSQLLTSKLWSNHDSLCEAPSTNMRSI